MRNLLNHRSQCINQMSQNIKNRYKYIFNSENKHFKYIINIQLERRMLEISFVT